jgi:hypothetical protein
LPEIADAVEEHGEKALMPRSPKLLRITSISAEPTSAPKAVPTPPARLAPPMTAAAITCNSSPVPRLVVMAPSQPVWMMPATPADSAEIM